MPGYLPIAEHALIGDLHTVALVGTDGTIDWYCCPRFDSPSVFGAILDSSRGGHWRITPIRREITTKQLYLPDTNIVITRFLTEDGVGELQDFMPIGASRADHSQRLVRRVSVARGEMRFGMELAPRFNYGRDPHTTNQLRGAVQFESQSLTLVLSSETDLSVQDGCATATFDLGQDQAAFFVLEQHEAGRPLTVPGGEAVKAQLDETIAYWRGWLRRSRYSRRWREMVHRSALTLKLLTYRLTGAIVAAPTASLPESLSGERNWDYRYTWIRDAAFTSYALLKLGFDEEAAAFMAWLTQAFADTDGGSGGPLRISAADSCLVTPAGEV